MKPMIFIIIVIALGIASASSADEFSDLKKQAEELRKQNNAVAAVEMFLKAAAVAPDDASRSDVLELAAYSAFSRRNQDPAMREKATNLATQIPIRQRSIKCRMILLREDYQYSALIEQFKNEDIAAWDDKALSAEVLSIRANVYSILKKGPEAAADMALAVKNAPNDPKYRLGLAGIHRSLLKDDNKAQELYQEILAQAGADNIDDEPYLSATLEMAAILRDRAEYELALEKLNVLGDMSALNSFEKTRALRYRGEILAAMGSEKEAVADFQEANRLQGR